MLLIAHQVELFERSRSTWKSPREELHEETMVVLVKKKESRVMQNQGKLRNHEGKGSVATTRSSPAVLPSSNLSPLSTLSVTGVEFYYRMNAIRLVLEPAIYR